MYLNYFVNALFGHTEENGNKSGRASERVGLMYAFGEFEAAHSSKLHQKTV